MQQHLCKEAPTLILGWVGFTRAQEEILGRLLAQRRESAVPWRTGSLPEADAWCVNGARTQLLGDGSLRVGPGEAGSRSVRLSLDEVDRPIAFSEPLASRDFEPAYSFRMEPRSLQAMLELFHTRWLAGKAARLWLAARLVDAEHTLTHRVYHLTQNGRLVATIDRTGEVGLMPGLTVTDLGEAAWLARPSSAACIPPSFHRITISELVWSYALRTEADLLPTRYRSARIYFRRPPRVAQRLIQDDHLLVMRELVLRAASFEDLLQRSALSPVRLARSLAALYLAGSITANPQRARQAGLAAGFRGKASNDESLWSPTRDRTGFGQSLSSLRPDFTVPARLPSATAPNAA